MSKKIVVTQDIGFFPNQVDHLKQLGGVKIYNDLAESYDEWLKRCEEAEIIITGKFGLKQRYQKLTDKFFSLPFVGIGFFDKDILKKNNLIVSYSPGCNKDAVSEWAVFMIINLMREFHKFTNATKSEWGEMPDQTLGLRDKKITILGKGNIGSRVGKICSAMDMDVKYFKRGDDLIKSIADADVIVNALSYNPTTKGILDKKFFSSIKKGAYLVDFTGPKIYDLNTMFEALDSGRLAGLASDSGSAQFGNINDPYYQKMQKHPKIIATPHIAHNSDITDKLGGDMVIKNIEAYLKGKPINIIN